jgi:hypothetical protein
MANELTVSVTLSFQKGTGSKIALALSGVFDVAGSAFIHGVQEIGTSEEAISLGGVPAANVGYMICKNLDATNFISIHPATGVVDLVKLNPGEPALFRLDDTDAQAPYALADTAACDLQYIIVEK